MPGFLLPSDLPAVDEALWQLLRGFSRAPEISSADLVAADQADKLGARILRWLRPHSVLLLNDSFGALSYAAASGGADVYSFQDRLSRCSAAENNLTNTGASKGCVRFLALDEVENPDEELRGKLADTEAVVLKLPRSGEELRFLTWAASRLCPQATVYCVGLQKYLSKQQTQILHDYYSQVQASRGFGKARALVASQTNTVWETPPPFNQRRHSVPELPGGELKLTGYGACFGSSRIDPGSRLLIQALSRLFPTTDDGLVIDLGCGNGTLGIALALLAPQLQVLCCDDSATSVRACEHSIAAHDLSHRIRTQQMDALDELPEQSVATIVLNPPFHSGHAVDTAIAEKLFHAAAHALVPGGTLWCVWNTPRHYTPVLGRLIGPTTVVARNAKFTVTQSSAQGRSHQQ